MLKKTSILSLVLLIVIMAACKKTSEKEVPPVNNDTTVTLIGTWTLTGIDVIQSTTIIGLPADSTDSVRLVYSDNYPMSAVTGRLVFTSDSLYVNGLSYSAQPQIITSVYTWPANVLEGTTPGNSSSVSRDSTDLAFSYLSVTGKDSVSFPQGGIGYPAVTLPIPLTPGGASYTFSGDTLKMAMLADTTVTGSALVLLSGASYFGATSHLVLSLVKK